MTGGRRPLWPLLLVPPTVAGIVILAWRCAALPLTDALWSLWGFFAAFGQGAIWAVLVFFFAVTVFTAFRGVKTTARPPMAHGSRDAARTRFAYWLRLISQGTTARFSGQPLVAEARHLVLAVLAHTELRTAAELESDILAGRIVVPDGVLRLFQREPRWARPRGLRVRLFPRARADSSPPVDAGWIDEIVSFLEDRLGAGPARPAKEGP